jgi:hypothetical protein
MVRILLACSGFVQIGDPRLDLAARKTKVGHGNGQPGATEAQAAIETGWLQRAVAQDRIAVDGLLDKLHIGEAEAISLLR